MRTLGLIVALIDMPFMYVPFTACGFSDVIKSMNDWMFSSNLTLSKLSLPTTAWTIPDESFRNSTLPALYSFTTFATSAVTVPALGDGIRPRGAQDFSKRADDSHHVGSCDTRVEVSPTAFDFLGQLFLADFISSSFFRSRNHVSFGKDYHPLSFDQFHSAGQRNRERSGRPALDLFPAESQSRPRLVKLRTAEALQHFNGFCQGNRLVSEAPC